MAVGAVAVEPVVYGGRGAYSTTSWMASAIRSPAMRPVRSRARSVPAETPAAVTYLVQVVAASTPRIQSRVGPSARRSAVPGTARDEDDVGSGHLAERGVGGEGERSASRCSAIQCWTSRSGCRTATCVLNCACPPGEHLQRPGQVKALHALEDDDEHAGHTPHTGSGRSWQQ
jgi:hypothetical protein